MPTEMKNHKWMVLSNTTLGMLAATINASIVLISLPAIFRGIGLKPLDPGNTNVLLWTIMGYMVVTSVLVVTFGSSSNLAAGPFVCIVVRFLFHPTPFGALRCDA